MKNLAIIPARSGSKGLKDKNIKLLNGKPLMAYAIQAAIDSGKFDEIMVSTDSNKYADIAREYGANVPFLRSERNARDVSTSGDMIAEVLDSYEKMNRYFDTFCLLQPTSPLRTSEDIKNAYYEYDNKKAIVIVSVCECEHPPQWCNALDEALSLDGFITPEESILRRQELGSYYRLNGAIYIADVSEFRKNRFLYRAGAYAYVMKNENSIDIDAELDFIIAERLIQMRK